MKGGLRLIKSIIQDEKRCFFCGVNYGLEVHHCLHGSRRKIADKYGLTVYLCRECHRGNQGVHFNKEKDDQLKRLAEETFEKRYGEDEWFRVVGKKYI